MSPTRLFAACAVLLAPWAPAQEPARARTNTVASVSPGVAGNTRTTTIAAIVQLEDGSSVTGAVLVTPVGGKGVSVENGAGAFDVVVPSDAGSLTVTAVATIGGTNYVGSSVASPIHIGGVTDGGIITLTSQPTCDPSWISTFGALPGMGGFGTVSALTAFDDGGGGGPALYAGGDFIAAGGLVVGRIARWDGTRWSGLGGGMDNTVSALAVFDDGSGGGPALYAGGLFMTAGGVAASRIARWNGATWSALGDGMDNTVSALTIFDDGSGGGPALYAGGNFTTAGGVAASRIARWNGTTWSALGSGMDNPVLALTVFDDGSGGGLELYAAGNFTTAGGVAASRIARWNGASWSALGSGMDNSVFALTVFDDGSGGGPALYAGGFFTAAGGVPANRIARWNGTTWSALGSGMTGNFVSALTVFDDGSGGGPALYAGGFFTAAGGVPANRIARWNGTTWSALGSGTSGTGPSAMMGYDDGCSGGPALYAGGGFSTAGGVVVNSIARWNGTSWSALTKGINEFVKALAVFDDGNGGGPALYAGGSLTTAGGVLTSHIARWDGTSWSALGSGVNGDVFGMAVFGDGNGGRPALYAGGSFTTAGGVVVNLIARWDGTSWSALGSGMTSTGIVHAMTAFDDGSGRGPALYTVGNFTTAGGVAASCIARWDGTSWSALGSGLSHNTLALTVFDDGSGGGPALYAGGFFTTAGGVAASHMARWNGASWSALGSGVSGGFDPFVYALAVFDDGNGGGPALYAGGQFTTAGEVATTGIARWDGTSWSAVGGGMDNSVYALTAFDDGGGGGPALYAGGTFTTAGGVAANRIARWNGASWSALGSGMNGGVVALTDFEAGGGPALYAGGSFNAFDSGDSYLAKWGCPSNCPWDLDGSGDVGNSDFQALLVAWGSNPVGPPNFDGDCTVGVVDFLELLANWGPCP